MLLSIFVQSERKRDLSLTQQRRLVFLNDVKQVSFYFSESCAQVCFEDELDSLEFHAVDD